MTEATFASVGVASYAVAAAGWLLLDGRAATSIDASPRRALLPGAALATAAWAALAAIHVRSGASLALGGANAASAQRNAVLTY